MNIFGKTRDASKFLKELPATQPITGREMRSCAWWLDRMPDTEKATANPEKIARDFLEISYLRHIEDREDRRKILNVMNTWTFKKRARI